MAFTEGRESAGGETPFILIPRNFCHKFSDKGEFMKHKFGLNLKTLRESAMLTVEQLARELGCPPHTIKDVESGSRPFPRQLIVPWSNALSIGWESMVLIMANDMIRSVCLELGEPLLFKVVPADWEADAHLIKQEHGCLPEEAPWRG